MGQRTTKLVRDAPARKASGKDAKPHPRKTVPTAALVVLLAAFGASLGLKAWEERQSFETATLMQQAREAEALAGHVRAELISARARMEGFLLQGASLDALRNGVPFETVGERQPPDGMWAQLSEPQGVRVFARDPRGHWVSGLKPTKAVMPAPLGGRTLYLVSAADGAGDPRFADQAGQRSAVACSTIANSGIAACVSKPAPLFTVDDLYRAAIYLLLLAGPLLAVYGLLRAVAAIRKESDAEVEALTKVQPRIPEASHTWAQFEVAGLIGLWRWDSRTQLLSVGPEAASLVGSIRSGDMTLDEFTSIVAEEDRRRIRSALERADPMRQISAAFQGSGPSTGKFFEMIGGASDGAFSGAILNVTDRIIAMHRSRRAEALARTALDAHPGPFAVWDSRKRLTHWNAAFPHTFNLDQSVVHPGASYDFVMAEASKFVRIERPLGDDSNGREMLLLSDQWIRMVDRRTANEGLISVGVDISALKRQEASMSRSERRLRSMVQELERTKGQAQELAQKYQEQKHAAERASQAKSAFLANMSHELRTPLNAIIGFSEMISNEVFGEVGDERYKGYAEDILGSGQHLLDMINDILDMAKVEAGKMTIEPKPIDASDAVDAAIRLIRRRAADKQVSMTFDPDDDLPEINGDHRAIKQMTLNLLANAIKFTEPGGEIAVEIRTKNRELVISVADTGRGIPEADLPRLGQPFEQANGPDGRPTQGGTGLGLALTKSFAEMHGGHLSIESEVGVGTTVSIWLPIPANATLAVQARLSENA